MCGRIDVAGDAISEWVSRTLGIQFQAGTNHDMRPTQELAAVVTDSVVHQQNMTWGIKPAWAKKLLINAQAETVHEKPTFKRAFAERRCIVPCSGWYEWSENSGRKRKYLFAHPEGRPLYIAGIFYPAEHLPEVVTLTTQPTEQCLKYHDRMPLIIDERCVEDWLSSLERAQTLAMMPVGVVLLISVS